MDTYSFGDFELDLAGMRLWRHGEPVHLERRPLDLLICLVRRPGRLIPREELIAELWASNVVIDFDTGLNTLVRKVRNALGDSADAPSFIETVPGRGYRFIAAVEQARAREPSPPAAPDADRPAPAFVRHLPVAGFVVALAAVVTLAWWYADATPETQRIAVMPFENLSGDESLSYLASGLAEETSMSLARIDLDNLRVIGGISTQAVAGSMLPARELGRRLGADFLVLSSLQAETPRIRVSSRLIRVADSEQVWSASFDREMTNLLGLQSELSAAIAEQIRLRLSPEVAAAIAHRQTQSPEAYELYLKGRYEWSKFLPSANEQALRYYRQAVEEDPGYALAWAGIAHLLATSTVTTDVPTTNVDGPARDALRHAMSLDTDLAEVQYAKGYIDFFIDWNLPEAEIAARRAVTLDPNSAIAQMLLGVLLSEIGNHVEALGAMQRARELDPLFSQTFALSAMVAWHAGDSAAALDLARQAVTIDPNAWVGYFHLGNAYLMLEQYAQATDAFADAERLSGGNSRTVSARAFALARAGRMAEARAILAELTARASREALPAVAFARIHAGLGELDSAFEWLDRALAAGELHASSLYYEISFRPLRGDPRFAMLTQGCPRSC